MFSSRLQVLEDSGCDGSMVSERFQESFVLKVGGSSKRFETVGKES